MEPIQGNVSIDAQNIMPIIKHWLYSDKDIFVREVVSNGCDAITKLRMVDSGRRRGLRHPSWRWIRTRASFALSTTAWA